MSLAVLAYVPNIPRLFPDAFLRNLNAYKTRHPAVLYSDDPRPGMIQIPDPTSVKLSKNRVAIQNLVFLAGLDIAQREGIKRFCYVELDTRFGRDYWDEELFEEAEPFKDAFAIGSPATYNRSAMSEQQRNVIDQACKQYTDSTGFPVPTYDSKVKRPIGCLFLMGSGCIFSTAIASDIFLGFERDMHQKAAKSPAFDLFMGMRCVQLFGLNAPKKLPFLTKSYSTYGNKQCTEEERIGWLKSGRINLAHQIKSNTDCL